MAKGGKKQYSGMTITPEYHQDQLQKLDKFMEDKGIHKDNGRFDVIKRRFLSWKPIAYVVDVFENFRQMYHDLTTASTTLAYEDIDKQNEQIYPYKPDPMYERSGKPIQYVKDTNGGGKLMVHEPQHNPTAYHIRPNATLEQRVASAMDGDADFVYTVIDKTNYIIDIRPSDKNRA